MKEWVLKNTSVTEEQYDELINSDEKNTIFSSNFKKQIIALIDEFTLNEPTPDNLEKWGIEKLERGYSFAGIKFNLLSEVLHDPKLFSSERHHQCHFVSFYLAQVFELSLVTAKCIDSFDCSFLHTFILSEERDLVFDYCLNLIMRKSDYYDLFDVSEIVKIEYPDLVDYHKILDESSIAGENINYREIVTFPSEIKEALVRLERTKK